MSSIKIEMDFDKRFRNLIKEHGNQTEAKKWVKKWFAEQTKFPLINASQDFKLYDGRLDAGKIYTFRYDNPVTKDTLAFWDTNPLVLSLGRSKKYPGLDLAINLNYLPPKFKRFFLAKMFQASRVIIRKELLAREKYKNTGKTPNVKNESPTRLYYDIAKKLVPKELSFCLRSYYYRRREKTIATTYERWEHLSLLEIDDFEKITLAEVYAQWRLHLKKTINNKK